MKNIVLVNPRHRFKIYFYSLIVFIIWYIICFIYVVHQNRYYIATEIKPVIFVYDRKTLDYYDADITNIKFNLVSDNHSIYIVVLFLHLVLPLLCLSWI